MTKQEAIDAIKAAWDGRDSEFCVGRADRDDSERELLEALQTLETATKEEEREACAKVADEHWDAYGRDCANHELACFREIAAAIRKRGQQ